MQFIPIPAWRSITLRSLLVLPASSFFAASTNRPARTALLKVSSLIPNSWATAERGSPWTNNSCARCNTSPVSTRGCRFRRGAKNAVRPPARSFFTCRFMLIALRPKARTNSACVQLPWTTHWLVNSRKLFRSPAACENTGRQPWK